MTAAEVTGVPVMALAGVEVAGVEVVGVEVVGADVMGVCGAEEPGAGVRSEDASAIDPSVDGSGG
ncbi:hypothetical protein, partial [Microtetraspora fusca]|uniref:hypothetical protein n=1 Tax=Microtetraspora fusca TaxID=1997 RepID=UPI000AF256D7